MKRFLFLLTLVCTLSLHTAAADDHSVPAAPPPESAEVTAAGDAPEWLIDLATRYPVAATILIVVGCLRLVIKPAIAAAHAYANSTATPKDDALIEAIEHSKILKSVAFALDWIGSLKLRR